MSKSHWGIKRVCNNGACGAKFYDFHERVITCPKCGGAYSQKLTSRSFADERLSASDDAVEADVALDDSDEVESESSESSESSDSIASEGTVSLEEANDNS